MRPMSVASAVCVIMVCVCVLQSAALPFSDPEVQFEEPVKSETAQFHYQGEVPTSARETISEVAFSRTKRQSHLSLCRYCCNCCKNKGCGFCCRF